MKETIFDQINKIKQVTNDYVGRLIDFYGSPECDEPVLNVTNVFPTFSCNGVVEIKKVKKANDGSILYVDNENKVYTYIEFPIEGILKIAQEISVQQGIWDMFNELFDNNDLE